MKSFTFLLLITLLGFSNAQEDDCMFTDQDGAIFNLAPLRRHPDTEAREGAWNFTIDQGAWNGTTIFLDICDDISTVCPSAGSCARVTEDSEPILLGQYNKNVLYNDIPMNVEMHYNKNGSRCNASSPTAIIDEFYYQTFINFTCGTGDDQGPFLIKQEGCTFYFEWQTQFVCVTALHISVRILLCVLLLCLSGLFSGLTLGLLSLDLIQLEILIASGTAKEKKYAKRIYPIRKHGNLLLCTLLIGNVIVNAYLSILLADITSGTVGLIVSSLGIVVFGEIVPQSLCHKHGLAVGYYTIFLVYFFVVVTFLLSYPISKILDYILGHELGTLFNQDALKHLLAIEERQGQITDEQTKMMTGALDFQTKTVSQIMTPLESVYMLEASQKLDLALMTEIMEKGHSRVPVYTQDRTNVAGIILLKDVAFLSPEDEIKVSSVLNFAARLACEAHSDTTLTEMLQKFRLENSHMAFVWKAEEAEDGGDNIRIFSGIVTLEDVIEELIQMEINDETDVFVDNVNKVRIEKKLKPNFGLVTRRQHWLNAVKLTEQQTIAVTAFLPKAVGEFAQAKLPTRVLENLLVASSVEDIQPTDQGAHLYKANTTADYFILVLQGKIQVTCGKENFVSELGPFSCMGAAALQEGYVADFTAIVKSQSQVLRVHRSHYEAARKAARLTAAELEKMHLSSHDSLLDMISGIVKSPSSGTDMRDSDEHLLPKEKEKEKKPKKKKSKNKLSSSVSEHNLVSETSESGILEFELE